jgi:hypothetical protein
VALVSAVQDGYEGAGVEQDVALDRHCSVAPIVPADSHRDPVRITLLPKADGADVGRTALSHRHWLTGVTGRWSGEVLLERFSNELRFWNTALAREAAKGPKHVLRKSK